jgi:hypothetical protein
MKTTNRRSRLTLFSLLSASIWLAGCSTPARVPLPDNNTLKAGHQAALTLADLPPPQVLIQSGDLLRIVRDAQEPAAADDMTVFVVRPDGVISIPNIGRVKAALRHAGRPRQGNHRQVQTHLPRAGSDGEHRQRPEQQGVYRWCGAEPGVFRPGGECQCGAGVAQFRGGVVFGGCLQRGPDAYGSGWQVQDLLHQLEQHADRSQSPHGWPCSVAT